MLSKLWYGQGTFEASVNTLSFAVGVLAVLVQVMSDLLSMVPVNLISCALRAFA